MNVAKELLSDAWRGLGWSGAICAFACIWIGAEFLATGNAVAGAVVIFLTALFVVQCILIGVQASLIGTQERLIALLKRGT